MGLAGVGLIYATSAHAQINPNGNPGDWAGNNGVTTFATGGPTGNGHTTIQVDPAGYGYGYGSGGSSLFGAGTSYSVSSPFTQSISVYINTSWASGAIPSQDGFWIDMSPNSSDPNLGVSPDYNYGEHNFRITSTGSGTINVGIDGNGTVASITQSGWYDFRMTYTAGGTPTSQVDTTMAIYDYANATILSSTTVGNDSVSSGLETQYLDGSGYVWLPVWAPGFASGTLDVANVNVSSAAPVPEASTVIAGALLLLPFGVSTLRILRKKRTA